MLTRMLLSLVLAWILCTTACDQRSAPSVQPLPSAGKSTDGLPTKAQPRLQTLKLWLGVNEIQAEIAMTRQEIATGMMFRTNVVESEGMLFVFGSPMRASFWMHNVPIPLTCAYIAANGEILEIREMKANDDSPIEAAVDTVQYVLEMKQGWFERNKVTIGTTVRTERGSFHQTFQRQQ